MKFPPPSIITDHKFKGCACKGPCSLSLDECHACFKEQSEHADDGRTWCHVEHPRLGWSVPHLLTAFCGPVA